MELTVALQNLGLAGDRTQNRWPQLLARLRPVRADILLLCEAPPAGALLQSFAGELEMAALPLPPSTSGIPPAILYRPSSVGDPVDYCTDFSREVTHGVIVAAFDVGLDNPWTAACTHISPFSWVQACRDIELASWSALRYGNDAFMGLDANQQPRGEMPELSRMKRIDITRRFHDPLGDPPRRPRTDVADVLAADGFEDCAVRLHQMTKDPSLLERTGKSGRIDWIMATSRVAKALTGGRRLDTPASGFDHAGAEFTFGTSRNPES